MKSGNVTQGLMLAMAYALACWVCGTYRWTSSSCRPGCGSPR